MPTVYVTRKAHFNAAHRLHNPNKSDAWNRATFGKCNNPNWHGHNYVMEVTVAGEPDPATGYVIDLSELKHLLKEHILDKLDHKNLNIEVDFMEGVIPSTENLTVAIFNELEPVINTEQRRLERVRVFETERNYAEYRGG